MALAEALLELTQFMSSEDAKKTFENLLTKEPTFETKLRESVLRQQDYDRQMNKTKEEVAKASTEAKEWKDWAADNVPIHERLVKEYAELEQQQKDLQEKLATAQAARSASGDDTVNAAELATRVKEEIDKLGYASKADMDRIIAEQSGKLAKDEVTRELAEANKKFFGETVPAMTNFAMDAAEISFQHMRETDGKALDRKEFSDFMTERKLTDPKKAYDEYMKPARDKATMDAEIAKREKAIRQEVEQQYSAVGLPGGGVPPGLQPKGAVQMRVEADQAAAAANNGGIGTKVAMNQAAAELRQEGKV